MRSSGRSGAKSAPQTLVWNVRDDEEVEKLGIDGGIVRSERSRGALDFEPVHARALDEAGEIPLERREAGVLPVVPERAARRRDHVPQMRISVNRPERWSETLEVATHSRGGPAQQLDLLLLERALAFDSREQSLGFAEHAERRKLARVLHERVVTGAERSTGRVRVGGYPAVGRVLEEAERESVALVRSRIDLAARRHDRRAREREEARDLDLARERGDARTHLADARRDARTHGCGPEMHEQVRALVQDRGLVAGETQIPSDRARDPHALSPAALGLPFGHRGRGRGYHGAPS